MTLNPATSAQRFNGGTLTTPLVIDQPDGDVAPGLVIRSDDQPNAYFRTTIDGVGGNAQSALTVQADAAGSARVLLDDDTSDGRVSISTVSSYLQPRSSSADADQFIEIVDTSGNDALVYQAGGALIFGRKTVIPDGNLAPGQFGFWLDATNGASKLMVKAKSANGTVATAAVALA